MRSRTPGISVGVLASFEISTKVCSGSDGIRLYTFPSHIQSVNRQTEGWFIATAKPSIPGALACCRSSVVSSEFADLTTTLVKVYSVIGCASSAYFHQLRPTPCSRSLRGIQSTLRQ
jgi:hypothetical protein